MTKLAHDAGVLRALRQFALSHKTAGILDLFGGKPKVTEPTPTPEQVAAIHQLADKYHLDRGYALKMHGPWHVTHPGATEFNMAAESDMQHLSGGPGVPWDQKRWGAANPLRPEFNSASGQMPSWYSPWTPPEHT